MADVAVVKKVFGDVNRVMVARNICLTILLLFLIGMLVKTHVERILDTFLSSQEGV